MSSFPKAVDVIGAGNVAVHLASGLHAQGVVVQHIANRDHQRAEALASMVGAKALNLERLLEEASERLLLVAVPDDAIADLAKRIHPDRAVVHSSGSVAMDALNTNQRKHFGVFYPLQSFSKDRPVDWTQIPICLEASTPELMTHLQGIAGHLSRHTHLIASADRRKIHLAAVMVNNFSNHLFTLAADYLEANDLPFDLLHALIRETAEKVQDMHPRSAQTGPARRHDLDTVNRHLAMLRGDQELKQLYIALSEQIMKHYHE